MLAEERADDAAAHHAREPHRRGAARDLVEPRRRGSPSRVRSHGVAHRARGLLPRPLRPQPGRAAARVPRGAPARLDPAAGARRRGGRRSGGAPGGAREARRRARQLRAARGACPARLRRGRRRRAHEPAVHAGPARHDGRRGDQLRPAAGPRAQRRRALRLRDGRDAAAPRRAVVPRAVRGGPRHARAGGHEPLPDHRARGGGPGGAEPPVRRTQPDGGPGHRRGAAA